MTMGHAHHCRKTALSGGIRITAHGVAVWAAAVLLSAPLLAGNASEPQAPGNFGTPPLHWRVDADDLDGARRLLKSGADANALTERGVSPLSLAVANGNAAMVQLLIRSGAKANQSEPAGETLLMQAAQVGETAVVKLLLDHGAEVNARDPHFGQTALMFAARAGHAPIASLLIARGAELDAVTKAGAPPAWVRPNSQAGYGFGIGIIRGGTPADRGRRDAATGGMTAIHFAARQGFADVVDLLIKAGAKVNPREANDITPLLMAISNNNVAAAKTLLAQGGEVNAQDWYGRSPLWEAVNVRNLYVHNATFRNGIDRSPVLELIKALLAAGANVNARTKETPPFRNHLLEITGSLEWVDFTGQTPFLTAALAGDVTVMKLLLAHGADPMIGTFQGTSALMAAAGVNWVVAQTWTEGPAPLLEAVKLCHELGMDVNQANSMGVTALHGAANRGSDDIIRFLVDKGADLTAQDNERRTALDWAKGVFLATHPAEPKPSSIALITSLLKAQGREVR
ncbi:MAG: ankyrin repeat domain-containing protein [Gammaproteobacteria bacterium]|nr:ankyrin repeat domain-containing protein [Gammaproteobacteria bacterium]